MASKEGVLLKKFLEEYSRIGSRLFRCQSGLFWAGKSRRFSESATIAVNSGDVLIRSARRVKVGEPGMSDLIGWTRVNITPDMVGRDISVYTAVEIKTARVQATKQQSAFIRTVNEHGGIAVIARKLDDILDAAAKYLGGIDENRH